MKVVIKRDNRQTKFNENKIKEAIIKAAEANLFNLSLNEISTIMNTIVKKIESINLDSIAVEQIQDLVVQTLCDFGYKKLAIQYQAYRKERNAIREKKSDLMKKIVSIGIETDRDNANVGNNFSAKLLRIASESNK